MNSIVMYNPMTTIDVNVFVAAAVVLITSAISSLITLMIQKQILKNNAELKDSVNALQDSVNALQESVNAVQKSLDVKPEIVEDEPELIVQEIIAPVVAQPVVPIRGNATDDEYIQMLQARRPNAHTMKVCPADTSKEQFIKVLIKLIKKAALTKAWADNNPDKVAANKEREKQRQAAKRAASVAAAVRVNRAARALERRHA